MSERSVMSIVANFELVEGVLLDPQLGLRVTAGSGFAESYSDAAIKIWFDPELRPDRLTMQLPEDQRWMWERSPTPAPEQIAFRSPQAEAITSISVTMDRVGEELRLNVRDSVNGFPLKAELIERTAKTGGRPADLIRSILLAAVRLLFWDQEAQRHHNGVKFIALYLSADVAQELGVSEAAEESTSASSDTLLVRRAVRS